MFNIGGSEMVALAILALLVFGPEGLPGIVKKVVRTVHALRTAASDFQTEVANALEEENRRLDNQKRQASAEPLAASSETVVVEASDTPPLAGEGSADEKVSLELETESEALDEESPSLTEAEEASLEPEATPEEPVLEAIEDDDGPGLPMKRPLKSVEA